MTNYDQAWQRLTAAARQTPDERETVAPYGFATRVAALAMTAREPKLSVIEHLSLRAMFVACFLAVAAVGANYTTISHLFDDETPPADDPVAALVDIAS
jgi:hypothetical protein